MPKFYCSTSECRLRWKNVVSKRKAPKCAACKAALTKLKRVSRDSALYQFIPDIPEHFNQSTNCVVKGRAHLRQIQREKGLSDYDPKEHSGPPTDWS